MQNYLNEYCYKFNRRYLGDKLFDRILISGISYRWDQLQVNIWTFFLFFIVNSK